MWYGPGRVVDASRKSRERERDGVSHERLGHTERRGPGVFDWFPRSLEWPAW